MTRYDELLSEKVDAALKDAEAIKACGDDHNEMVPQKLRFIATSHELLSRLFHGSLFVLLGRTVRFWWHTRKGKAFQGTEVEDFLNTLADKIAAEESEEKVNAMLAKALAWQASRIK